MTTNERITARIEAAKQEMISLDLTAERIAEATVADEWYDFTAAFVLSALHADAIWVYCQSNYGTN